MADVNAGYSRTLDPGLFTIYAEGGDIEGEVMELLKKDISDEELEEAIMLREIAYLKHAEKVSIRWDDSIAY